MSEAKNIAMKDVAISVSGNTSVKNGWKRERIRSARPAARYLPPNAPMPSIAVMPADKRRTGKVLRIILSPQNEDLTLCVTKTVKSRSLFEISAKASF